VAWRGFRRLTAAAAVGFLVLLLVSSAQATVDPPPPADAAGASGPVPGSVREAAELTGCEQRLQPGRRPGVPAVAIVGASITAGVGAEDPAGSWAVLLARQLHWNAFVYGVPGAGYVHAGLGRKGPVAAEVDGPTWARSGRRWSSCRPATTTCGCRRTWNGSGSSGRWP